MPLTSTYKPFELPLATLTWSFPQKDIFKNTFFTENLWTAASAG